jgi:hypothetical protein
MEMCKRITKNHSSQAGLFDYSGVHRHKVPEPRSAIFLDKCQSHRFMLPSKRQFIRQYLLDSLTSRYSARPSLYLSSLGFVGMLEFPDKKVGKGHGCLPEDPAAD